MRYAPASVLVAPLAIAMLLGTSLLGIDRLGFRDVSHFYTPLYEYVAARQSDQWLPLWNPLDHTGLPLAGETTTAVFYPIRWLVYRMPISGDLAMSWYVALHLMLASVTAWLAARWSGVSTVASGIASVAYALSGSVFFLYTNPPFLVGAAWLPLVLGMMLQANGASHQRRAILSAVSLAMMVLGGDPHTALHSMIVVSIVWITRSLRRKPTPVPLRVMLGVPISACFLSMPQIAASLDWSRNSDRVGESDGDASWFSPPVVGSRRHQAYQFSLPPWHGAELVTPNAFGQLFPTNHRISRLIPGDGRMWTPSIYMGILVAVTCLARLWRSPWEGIDTWTGVGLLSLTLAMGHFGAAWWVQATVGFAESVDSAAFGPYWFLYHVFPGYDSFRYPAKWLSVFALAAAITAARCVDQEAGRERVRQFALPTLILLVLATITAWLGSSIQALIHGVAVNTSAADEFWGPLEVRPALQQITFSFIHSVIAAGILTWLLWREHRGLLSTKRLHWFLLLLIACDTAAAARGFVVRIPRSQEQRLVQQYESVTQPPDLHWMRTRSDSGWPQAWSESASEHRAIEVEASQRVARFGRWHLAHGQPMLNNMVSIQSRDMATFWQSSGSLCNSMTVADRVRFWQAIRDWLGIRGVIHTTPRSKEVTLGNDRYRLVDRLVRIAPNARVDLESHQQWMVIDDQSPDVASMTERLREIASGKGLPRIHHPSSTVAPADADKPADAGVASRLPTSIAITPGAIKGDQVTFEVRLTSPTLLTRSVYQDGNWHAWFQTEGSQTAVPTEVYQVDFLTQGVVLPPGYHQLHLRYRPWWLSASLFVAILSWILAISYLPIQKRLKTRSRISSV